MISLENLQKQLIASNYDAFIIPTSDFHGSEYISDYFKARKYFSGFTGSAGTLLVLQSSVTALDSPINAVKGCGFLEPNGEQV